MRQLAIGFVLVTLLAAALALGSMGLHPDLSDAQSATATSGTDGATDGGAGAGPSGGGSAATAVERCNETLGATAVEWDCSFHDDNYTLGETLSVTVTWDVLSGDAKYDSFDLRGKGFTPVAKRDPATGDLVTVVQSGNAVTFDVRFDELHETGNGERVVGNAHLKLYLWIDEDGDGAAETLAGFGVNLHVEGDA